MDRAEQIEKKAFIEGIRVEASLLMTEERYKEASHILKISALQIPQRKTLATLGNCLKALKYTVAPKEIVKTRYYGILKILISAFICAKYCRNGQHQIL